MPVDRGVLLQLTGNVKLKIFAHRAQFRDLAMNEKDPSVNLAKLTSKILKNRSNK